jgi:hypothetical protein
VLCLIVHYHRLSPTTVRASKHCSCVRRCKCTIPRQRLAAAILSSMPLFAKSGTRPATPSCKQPAVWADLDNDAYAYTTLVTSNKVRTSEAYARVVIRLRHTKICMHVYRAVRASTTMSGERRHAVIDEHVDIGCQCSDLSFTCWLLESSAFHIA